MADISKITPPGSQTTYNLKDATAREQVLIVAENGGGINKLNPIPMFTSGQYAAYNATNNTYGETAGHLDTYSNLRFMIQACTGTTSSDFTVVSTLVNSNITQNGTPAWLFTKLSTFNRLYVGHNGSQMDCKFFFDISNLEDNQKYYLCVNITNYTHANNEPFTWKNVMVLSEEDYLSGLWQVYQPYSLPNTKITPELIELVDSGAKNLVSLSTLTGTRWFDNTINLPAGDYVLYLASLTTTASASVCQVGVLKGGDVALVPYTSIAVGNNVYVSFSISETATKLRIYADADSSAAVDKVVTVTNPMICTKAAWDVSQKYVPYRPTYEETVEQVAENENNISSLTLDGNTKTGDLNDISVNEFAVYDSSALHLPVTKFCFVRTSINNQSPTTSRLQEVFVMATGASYVRTMSSGNWGNWLMITPNE